MDIANLIKSKRSPFFITIREGDGGLYRDGVGCMYEKISARYKVAMTCRHTVNNIPEQHQLKLLLGPDLTELEIVSPAIYPKDLDLDIAFFLVKDKSKTETLYLGEANRIRDGTKLQKGSILFNLKNTYQHGMHMVIPPIQIFRQQIDQVDSHCLANGLTKESEFVAKDNETVINQLKAKGWIQYHVLRMLSEPGCSGSPIFDKNLKFYGINLRGTPDLHVLSYMSSSQIAEQYKILKEEILSYKP